MGKTKIKTIDDSVRAVEHAQAEPKETPISEIKSVVDDSVVKPKSTKKGRLESSKKRSKKYQEVCKDLDRSKTYPIDEAVDMVKKLSYAKFNATIEAHINTAQTGLRGFISLPYASGKKLRILAFPPAKLTPLDKKELEDEGIVFGDNFTIDEINKGKVDFDVLITTPEWMPKLAKVAKFLGPKGLMPNPKNGTIVYGEAGLKKAVESFQQGKTEYKTEPKASVIHLALGKLNQPNEELVANITTLLSTLGKSKIKKVSLSPTMGPALKVDLASI